jgi:general secretion pathway protein A
MALAASPGMGKTTLLFRLLETLRESARTIFIFQTQCNPEDFCRFLVRDLGLVPGPDLAAMHEQMHEVLLKEAELGNRFVMIVDEAQGLRPSVLETIRLLSNFETSGRKLLQIILAGQLGFLQTLMRQDMEQLRQRVSMVASLKPFNAEEVASYISHRLKVAGHYGPSLFSDEAIQSIARGSKGIPRNINNICFNALSIGYAMDKRRIGREVIHEVLTDLKIESLVRRKRGVITAGLKSSFDVPAWLQRSVRKSLVAGTALIGAVLAVAAFAHNRASIINQLRARVVSQSPRLAIPRPAMPQPAIEAASAPALERPTTRTEPRVVVVAPGQTLSGISKRYLGKYDAATASELRVLNPSLTSPDHIEVGGKISLPADASGAEESRTVEATDANN